MDNNLITVTSPLLPDLDEFHELLKQIWDSKWITNNGQFHKQLEAALKEYLGVPQVSLFTNGTIACQNAELADQGFLALLLGFLHLLDEFLGAGFRDGAEVLLEVFLGHPDAVVLDLDITFFRVRGEEDLMFLRGVFAFA